MQAPPWTSRTTAALVVLVLGACLTLSWTVHPYFDATNDGAVYILTARAILHGSGYSYLGSPFTLRPPGFSLVLAPVLAAAGLDFRALNLVVSLFGVAGVALFFVCFRPRLGTAVALALSAAVWLNPGYQRLCTQVMSDVPGAALMLASLIVERWASRRPLPYRDPIFGACIAAAAYFRTIYVLVLPAAILARLVARRRAPVQERPPLRLTLLRLAAPAGVTLALLVPWSLRDAAVERAGPAEHTWNYSYWVSLVHSDRGDASSSPVSLRELRHTARRRTGEIVTVLGARMIDGEPTAARTILGLAAELCLLLVLLRRRETPEILAALLLLAMTLYYSSRPRLVLPLFLVALAAAADLARLGLRRLAGGRAAAAAVAALAILAAVHDLGMLPDRAEIAARHERLEALAHHVAERFAPGVPLAAEYGAIYQVYMGRPVYNFGPVCRRSGLPGFLAYAGKYGVRGLILNPATDEPCGLDDYVREHAQIDDTFKPILIAALEKNPA